MGRSTGWAAAMAVLWGTLPAPAAACGGLFCDTAQPVQQAGESILFAEDQGRMHMVVRLSYAGPPAEFGWLLPVPADVEAEVSSELLFQNLDRDLTPAFAYTVELQQGCPAEEQYAGQGGTPGAGGSAGGGGEPGSAGEVDVIDRSPLGPYDRVLLRAQNIGDLRAWLGDNGFQFPAGSEALLQPYLEMNLAFMALKLQAGNDAGDVVPLHLSFTSPTPAIPLRPTAVAAIPDMPVRVHLLGGARAVPINFRHVVLDEARIDWLSGGFLYDTLVAQAVDEAGGQAFATDFAGPYRLDLGRGLTENERAQVAGFRTYLDLADSALAAFFLSGDPDVLRVLRSAIEPPDGVTADQILGCPWIGCGDLDLFRRTTLDGAAFLQRLDDEVFGPRATLGALSAAHPYMTRLSTTLDAAEMSMDPVFDFNADLDPVPRTRTATWFVPCSPYGGNDYGAGHLALSDGRFVALSDPAQTTFPLRQGGQTVRGGEVKAALIIEQHYAAGQPDAVADLRPTAPGARVRPEYPTYAGRGGGGGSGGSPGSGARGRPSGGFTPGVNNGVGGTDGETTLPTDPADGSDGCDCDATEGGPGSLGLLGLLLLLGRRRRRSHAARACAD